MRPVALQGGSYILLSPLVHCEDLANLCALALERTSARSSYIGAAIEGLAVGRIARGFAKRFGPRRLEPETISINAIAAELGAWARGYALDPAAERRQGAARSWLEAEASGSGR